MIYYVLIFLAALGCAVTFALTKVYQIKQGNTLEFGVFFNFISGLFGAILYFAICRFNVEITPFSLVIALLFTLFFGAYTIIGFKIMSLGSMAVYTIFLMLGGMVLPYFYGLIFLNEEITAVKVIALAMMIYAIILQKEDDGEKGRALFYILCIAVFILNGGCSIVSKVHQITEKFEVVLADGLILLKNILQFLIFGAMVPFVVKQGEKIFPVNAKIYLLIIAITIVNNVAYMLQLVCSSYIPATVQFPVLSGGTIVFSALLGLICFKEALSRKQIAGIIVCVISTILFVI